MNSKKEAIGKVMADLLEIPGDLVLDLPKITMLGREELYLENHKGIIEYSQKRLRVNLARGFMEVLGNQLEIKALLPDEMKISGEIKQITFFD